MRTCLKVMLGLILILSINNPTYGLEGADSNKLKKELTQLISKRSKALIEKDIDYFKELLSENFVYTNTSGKN